MDGAHDRDHGVPVYDLAHREIKSCATRWCRRNGHEHAVVATGTPGGAVGGIAAARQSAVAVGRLVVGRFVDGIECRFDDGTQPLSREAPLQYGRARRNAQP